MTQAATPVVALKHDATIVYALQAYSFVLDGAVGEVRTLGELAQAIPQAYDLENPRNKAIVDHLNLHPTVEIVRLASNYWTFKD